MNTLTSKEAIYLEYKTKVRGYIFGKIGNHHDAEDLASEVFIKIFEKLDSFDERKASMSTWIYTITRNSVTDYYRTRKEYIELNETLLYDSDDLNVDETDLELLANALEKLDIRKREIIILRYFKNLNLKSIAEKLDISYSYTKMLHNAALAELRKQLQT